MEEGRIPVRNIILLGHSHAGKTQLSEALLFAGGAIPGCGNVKEGTTQSDYTEDEKERKVSISSSILSFTTGGMKINIIDVPGYGDFVSETVCGMRAADGAIILVNAAGGIEIGTNKALKLIEKHKMPAIIFINKVDKENADLEKCMNALREKLGNKFAPLTYPDEKALAEKLAETFVENVAETDDELLQKYLDEGKLSMDEAEPALKKAILENKIIPVMSGSAISHAGVKELLGRIVEDMPSPTRDKNDSFGAQVFKTISDPYVGQISVFRVFSGKVISNTSMYNASKKKSEKIGHLFSLRGKEHTEVAEASTGDIVCVAKLKNTETGDSLSTEKNQILFEELHFPEPAMSFSIKPKTRSDEDKISSALHKLTAEDMTFKVLRDAETKELVISGMGDLHLTVMIKRLSKRFGVAVDVGTPKVAYREAITVKGDAHYKHKKQSGGAGQFAEVWLRVEPLPRGTGFEFVNEIVGGAIPGPFIVSCEKGIKKAMEEGALAGFPLADVRAIVYDGKTHPVDSKDIAFQIAARHGFKEAVLKSKPVILEPIMDVDVTIPDEFMGDITGSLSSRRGRILGMEPGISMQLIKAKVPLEEMYKWSNELKSFTGGRGSYAMKFSHYEVVPANLVQAIVDKAKKVKEEAKV